MPWEEKMHLSLWWIQLARSIVWGKRGCEDVVRVGKYIVNICGFCAFIKSSFSAPAVL